MLDFLKKPSNIIAPISGETINITEVPDPVFSEKMAGDGIAIKSTGDVVVAPCSGTLSLIMDSKHAFAITAGDGLEILVHVGLETVELGGEGFEVLAEVNTNVTAGTPILKLDRAFIESKGFPLITPVVIVNHDKLKLLKPVLSKTVTAGKDAVMEYKMK